MFPRFSGVGLLDSRSRSHRRRLVRAKAYPEEFRRKVLDLVAAGRSVAQVAADLDISDQTICVWREQDLIDTGQIPGPTSAELIAAKRRIRELEHEVAILKRARELLRSAGARRTHPRPQHRRRIQPGRTVGGTCRDQRPARRQTGPATASDSDCRRLVNRAFTRSRPNHLWVTDITEHYTREGKGYCAVVLDTHSRRVVGWSIDSPQTATLVTNALGMAISNRAPEPGTIIHSDHGVQFTSWAFTDRARRSGWCRRWGRSVTATTTL